MSSYFYSGLQRLYGEALIVNQDHFMLDEDAERAAQCESSSRDAADDREPADMRGWVNAREAADESGDEQVVARADVAIGAV